MFIHVNQTQLFFDVYGSKLKITQNKVIEKPTLIVLHGGHGFADHTLYVEFWSKFSDMMQVIFIDQRGCGRSASGQASEWNLQQWATDLYQFCLALAIEKPIIAGVSMGGHVMCEFVSQYHDYAGGLIFCNTEAHFPLDLVCQKLQELSDEKTADICREFYQDPNRVTFANYAKYCIPYYGKNAYSVAELARCVQHPEVFLHYCKTQILYFNYLNELKKIQCPTLLLVGEDSLHVVEAAYEMAKNIPSSWVTMEVFPKVGGPVYKDDPEKSYHVVRNFLKQFSALN